MADATLSVSLLDVEPVRDLVVAGIRLYDALYHMPGAADFLTKHASKEVGLAYMTMGQLVRTHHDRSVGDHCREIRVRDLPTPVMLLAPDGE